MPPPNGLSLHCKLTRWIVLQKARRHRTSRLRLLVSTQFQGLFHSPPGDLFTFPSRYLFTIDHKIYLALEGGPPRFRQGSTCPALLEKTNIRSAPLSHTRLSRPVVSHSNYSASKADFLPYGDLTGYSSQERVLEASSSLSWSFVISQPLISIRLSTYSPSNKLPGKNLKGLRSSHFARHYFGNRYLLSLPQPTKMFQFGRYPFKYPIYSGNDNST
jgi:hypothetical protein